MLGHLAPIKTRHTERHAVTAVVRLAMFIRADFARAAFWAQVRVLRQAEGRGVLVRVVFVIWQARTKAQKRTKKKEMAADEALMRAWEYSYANRHRRLM